MVLDIAYSKKGLIKMTYQEYIHQKLKRLSLLERVNSQSKQIQLFQKNSNGQENISRKELPEEEIYFSHKEWEKLTKENIEKDFAWKMEDGRQAREKAFKRLQARSFQNSAISALYGSESLESYEESLGK